MVRYESSARGVEAAQLASFFVGWPKPPPPETLLGVLDRAPHVVLAWDAERVVGFVYAVSDGALAAYVPLLEVLPSHQRLGIGSELMRRLLGELAEHYMVDVVCDVDTAAFYEQLGFTRLAGLAWRNRDAAVLGQGG